MILAIAAISFLPLAFVLAYIFAFVRHYWDPLRIIPGDDKLHYPITGDIGKVLAWNCKIRDVLWKRVTTNGDIWRTTGYYGKIRITVARPDLIKQILVSNASKFYRGDPTGVEGIYIVGGLDNLLTSSGDVHKLLRRVASPGFRPSILKACTGQVENMAKVLAERWDEGIVKSGNGVYVNDRIQSDLLDYALDSLGLVALGFDFGCLRSRTKVAESILRIVRASYLNTRGIIPFMKYYNHFIHRILLRNWKLINMMPGFGPVAPSDIQLVIQTAREQVQRCENGTVSSHHKCLLQVILSQCEKGCITEDQMVSLLAIFILAGTETSSIALCWALWNLAGVPEIQEDAAEECQNFLKNGEFSWDDVMDDGVLRVTKLALRESLRLYPPVHSVSRRNIEDVEIAGFHVPKGTDFMVSIVSRFFFNLASRSLV